MSENRLSIYASFHIGLSIGIYYGQIEILIPFIRIHIAVSKAAKGIEIFGHYWD